MEYIEELFVVEPDSWMESLRPYQQNMMNQLYREYKSYEKTAEVWLTASMSATVPFGTEKRSSIFLDKLLDELEAFLSGDEKYNEDRLAILQEKGALQTYAVGVISVALSSELGTSAAFIAPAIALLLVMISKMGVNAWLAMRKEKRETEVKNQ